MPGHDDQGMAQSPLKGAILCCTAIAPERRSALAAIAEQMGAEHKYDLTSDTTHLIVGTVDSLKYQWVAKHRPDVKVLAQEWVEAVRDSWMEGGDTDVSAFEKQYRLPTFFGLRVSITGFENMEQRRQIDCAVTENGGHYSGDLTKQITHLVAAAPEGKKYNHARTWNIKVVSLEWLKDSMERGMVLEESLYDPLLPLEERGKGAWNRSPPPPPTRKRPRENQADDNEKTRRKLRRTASVKLESQNENIWAHITQGAQEAPPADEWQDDQHNATGESSATVSRRSGGQEAQRSVLPSFIVPDPRSVKQQKPASGIFQGRPIYIHGFDAKKTSILKEHLVANGARVFLTAKDLRASAEELEQGRLVLPHDIPLGKAINGVPSLATKFVLVTEWWVEKCLHSKAMVDPSKTPLCEPFIDTSIKGFDGITVCSTSFCGIDLVHVSKIVNLTGAKYDEFLRSSTSVLVCNSATPSMQKLSYANQNSIPAVSAKWLWTCIEAGAKQPFDEYLINSPQPASRVSLPSKAHASSAETKPDRRNDAAVIRRHPDTNDEAQSDKQAKNPTPQGPWQAETASEEHTQGYHDPDHPHLPNPDESDQARHETTSPQPLQEIPVEVNSPQRASQRSQAQPDDSKAQPSASAPDRTSVAMNESIALLLAQKQASRPTSAPDQNQNSSRRRRHGLIGRATSMNSNPSTDATNGGALSAQEFGQSATQEPFEEQPAPTQVIYEDPGVQKQREEMIRKMGGKVDNSEMRATTSIGVVKDVGEERTVGVAGRVKRKARARDA